MIRNKIDASTPASALQQCNGVNSRLTKCKRGEKGDERSMPLFSTKPEKYAVPTALAKDCRQDGAK